jgi:pimeloyl-ACP methyl ester carboxylesterase
MSRRTAAVVYAALWGASAIVRYLRPPPVSKGTRTETLSAGVRLAYLDSGAGPPVLLIHGSPGSSDVLRDLMKQMPPRYRCIVPDLPGFGGSTRKLPDYSFKAHAGYLLELMDRLGIRRAHLVAFSMGGGVALSIAALAPDRVSSIAMISAIGVQENELLGNYTANHIVHGALLSALWLLRECVPHFGYLDHGLLTVEFARNFYDSDQRPLRSVLERYRGPMLIIHGDRDPHVPLSAALEHHRLVTQSQLVILDDNHYMIFERPGRIAGPLVRFLDREYNTGFSSSSGK